MVKTPWEWSYGTQWVIFSDVNQHILNARELEPSMSLLRLIEGENGAVVIEGRPENTRFRTMLLTVAGMTTNTSIRRGRAHDDVPFFAVVSEQAAVPLTYDVGRDLFEEHAGIWMPRLAKTTRTMGARTFVADEGRLYEVYEQGVRELIWRRKDLTRSEFEHAMNTRMCWEFKPAFRWQRMHKAIRNTNDTFLLQALDSFSPQWPSDATAHGPLQFPDMIRELWRMETNPTYKKSIETAMERLDSAYTRLQNEDDSKPWTRFDPVMNASIERARKDGRNGLTFRLRQQYYMLLFEPGSGASGTTPVLLRPARYRRILQSMEDDVVQQVYEQTLTLCNTHGVDQNTWSRFLQPGDNLHSELARHFPTYAIPAALQCIQNTHHMSERVVARQQTYMPALLEKYKECEIRQAVSDTPPPQTRLDRHVEATLQTGLCVPVHINESFDQLIQFIVEHRSTKLHTAHETSECILCHQETPLLGGHCGEAKACLACWCTSLAQRQMKCGFCNQTVAEGQLRLVAPASPAAPSPAPPTKLPTVAKTRTTFDGIRQRLHAHSPALNLNASYRMEHWYRKMLQCNLITIHQRPKHPQKKKTLDDALQEFHLL